MASPMQVKSLQGSLQDRRMYIAMRILRCSPQAGQPSVRSMCGAMWMYTGHGTTEALRRWAPKVLHMSRKGSRCQTTPRLENCLDNALRIVPELSLASPQCGLTPPYWVQKTPLRSVYAPPGNTLGSSTKGFPSEDRVRADTSAVQDFRWGMMYHMECGVQDHRSCDLSD